MGRPFGSADAPGHHPQGPASAITAPATVLPATSNLGQRIDLSAHGVASECGMSEAISQVYPAFPG